MGCVIEDNVGMDEYALERIHRLDERLATRRRGKDGRVPLAHPHIIVAEIDSGYAVSLIGAYGRTSLCQTVTGRFLYDVIDGASVTMGRNFKVRSDIQSN